MRALKDSGNLFQAPLNLKIESAQEDLPDFFVARFNDRQLDLGLVQLGSSKVCGKKVHWFNVIARTGAGGDEH